MRLLKKEDVLYHIRVPGEPFLKIRIANLITGTRILCSVALLFCPAFSLSFFVLYLAAVLNVLDTYGINGKEAQLALEEIGITTNKNMIPNDTLPPAKASGLRIGFAAVTTRGCTKEQAEQVAVIINNYLNKTISKEKAQSLVKELTSSWKLIQNI